MAEYVKKDDKRKLIPENEKYRELGKTHDPLSPQLRCDRFMYELQHPSLIDRVEKKGRKGAGLEMKNN